MSTAGPTGIPKAANAAVNTAMPANTSKKIRLPWHRMAVENVVHVDDVEILPIRIVEHKVSLSLGGWCGDGSDVCVVVVCDLLKSSMVYGPTVLP